MQPYWLMKPSYLLARRYRNLGIALTDGFKSLDAKKQTSKTARDYKWEGKRESRRLEFSNFLKNLGKGIGREY